MVSRKCEMIHRPKNMATINKINERRKENRKRLQIWKRNSGGGKGTTGNSETRRQNPKTQRRIRWRNTGTKKKTDGPIQKRDNGIKETTTRTKNGTVQCISGNVFKTQLQMWKRNTTAFWNAAGNTENATAHLEPQQLNSETQRRKRNGEFRNVTTKSIPRDDEAENTINEEWNSTFGNTNKKTKNTTANQNCDRNDPKHGNRFWKTRHKNQNRNRKTEINPITDNGKGRSLSTSHSRSWLDIKLRPAQGKIIAHFCDEVSLVETL